MTADQGLYMLARHGEYNILGGMLCRAPVMGSDALRTVLMLSHHAGRCAELLKEVSPLLLVYTAARLLRRPCWYY